MRGILIILLFSLIWAPMAECHTLSVAVRSPVGRNLQDSGETVPGKASFLYLRIYRRPLEDWKNPQGHRFFDIYRERPERELRVPVRGGQGSIDLENLQNGAYFLVAWLDTTPNCRVDYDPPEPLGWYAREFGRIEPVRLGGDGMDQSRSITIDLFQVIPPPVQAESIPHGGFTIEKGYPVLRLRGSREEMEYAHGFLLGARIMDFFQFYLLESLTGSVRVYESEILPLLRRRLVVEEGLLKELQAMVRGMRDSGCSMWLEPMGRELEWIDLLALNSYGEAWGEAIGCTQAAFWGDLTGSSGLRRGLIAGRNMDGECDLRKVTVINLLVIVREPSEGKRWVSFGWPGFVGTYSGINEDGLYAMLNFGGRKAERQTGSGAVDPETRGNTPVAVLIRSILESASALTSASDAEIILKQAEGSGGGACGTPSIIFFASPFNGQPNPAFVYEGDRFGGAFRFPGDDPPGSSSYIVGANHFLKYGVLHQGSIRVFDRPLSLSSANRCSLAMGRAEWWRHTGYPVAARDIVKLLRDLTLDRTEHSIIFAANDRTVYLANDDLRFDGWNAPFQPWTTFSLDELLTTSD